MFRNSISKIPLSLGRRNNSTFLKTFNHSIESLPQREAAFYKDKSLKWSAMHYKKIIDAHANGLLDIGVQPGDRIALWLPADKAEKHVASLAAVSCGLTIVDVDQKEIQTVADLREFLKLADCKAIYFDLATDELDCIKLLRKAIPEFFYYEDQFGNYFHSKHFPSLKYFIHTGFDNKPGCLNYKNIYVTDPLIENSLIDAYAAVTDETAAYVKASKGANGWQLGKLVNHKDLLSQSSWYFAKNITDKQYFEGI